MQGANLHITKGAILAYRVFDIAHEIDLKKAHDLFNQGTPGSVRRYQLKKDPLRSITFRQAPLILSVDNIQVPITIKEGETKIFSASLEIKVWDYGVISLCYRINLKESLLWKDLVVLGSILDSDSIIDNLSNVRKEEIISEIGISFKQPYTHSLFEDYTTYLIEEVEEHVTKKNKEGDLEQVIEIKKIKDPLEVIKKASVAELLLAESDRSLSDGTKKSVLSNLNQYTKKDLIVMDWNSAVVFDFTKEKEYQDYVDIIEFSLAQLLELRIYDQLLDEKLEQLYDSMEDKKNSQIITDFYSLMSEEASRLYMEFSDVFEKLDNSIKTVGDFYLAKILKSADKKFGFEELKKSMSRKIETLANISKIYQDKIDSLVDEKRNKLSEENAVTSHRMELIVIILITIEVLPFVYASWPKVLLMIKNYGAWLHSFL
jgi:hypothetical protein